MKKLLSLLLLCAWVAPAMAHTTLASATPKGGSELAASPSAIELKFAESAKLTSVVVVGEDKQERRLEFVAGEQPLTFKVVNPNLTAGRNEVQWKALSHDGHVISGKLVYIVKPAK